jgi:RNA polymerase sigma-70 factor (ECF subfamily)
VELAEIASFKALKEGDETAFEMIFKSYYEPLCNYAFTFILDRDEAEEIVQATFLNVWEKRGTITIETSLKAYLYRAVRNSCLNTIKHAIIKRKHAAETMFVSDKSHEAVSQSVISSELDQKIGDALLVLPEQCRLVFKMSRFEELKYAEIAEQLNISIKTVENQIGKALKIMREELKEYLPILIMLMNGFIY